MVSFRAIKSPRYFEWTAHPSRSVIVAGVGRSGTTWLGDVVSRMLNARVVFEPCLTDRNGSFLIGNDGRIDLDARCERPLLLWKQADFEKQKARIAHLLFGCIKGDWVDQDVRPGVYSKRVIKAIRVNLFIGQILRNWPQVKMLYIIRSPHAVVESMLNQEMCGWKFDWTGGDIARCLEACEEGLDLPSSFSWNKDAQIDRLALRWCIEVKMALKQLQGADNCLVLQYESLIKGREWSAIALFLNDRGCRHLPEQEEIRVNSRTSSEMPKTIRLSPEQVARVHQLVETFGLGGWIA